MHGRPPDDAGRGARLPRAPREDGSRRLKPPPNPEHPRTTSPRNVSSHQGTWHSSPTSRPSPRWAAASSAAAGWPAPWRAAWTSWPGDPAPNGEAALRARMAGAGRAGANGLAPGASPERLRWARTVEACVADADFIQESAPETLQLKIDLHAQVARSPPGRADRLVHVRPAAQRVLRPRHAPSAAWSGIRSTRSTCCRWSRWWAARRPRPRPSRRRSRSTALGMKPLHARKEVPGFHRRPAAGAQWREALHLVNDGVASTGEIDDAIRYGAGIRWSFGQLPDPHPGWRRRRHAPLHGPVRPRRSCSCPGPSWWRPSPRRALIDKVVEGHGRATGRQEHRRPGTLPRRLPDGRAGRDPQTKIRHAFRW